MSEAQDVWFLGPQYHAPNLGEVFPEIGFPDGPLAVVTAGWQEREGEDDELDRYVDGRSVDLELYRRADEVFREDPEFRSAHRAMQRELRAIESLYDLRLSFVVEGVRRLLVLDGEDRHVAPEQDHAIQQLRELDAWHLQRIIEVRSEFEDRVTPLERDAVARHRKELGELMRDAAGLIVTGGHVAVLLNRLRLFGLRELCEGKTVLAWSAGAMVMTERLVLFHDHPPQGPGNAEVLENGLGLCRGIVALPDGQKRLDLDKRERVASLARRFSPDACIVLGDGDAVHWDGKSWSATRDVTRLGEDGSLEKVSEW